MNNEAFAQAQMEYEVRKTAKCGVFFRGSTNFIMDIRRVVSVRGVGLYGDVEASRTRIQ